MIRWLKQWLCLHRKVIYTNEVNVKYLHRTDTRVQCLECGLDREEISYQFRLPTKEEIAEQEAADHGEDE